MEQMNPELFTYELWEPDFWFSLDLSFSDATEPNKLISKVKQYGIGYCDSSRLQCRPKDNKWIAVMCEKDGRKFWFHIFKDDLDE